MEKKIHLNNEKKKKKVGLSKLISIGCYITYCCTQYFIICYYKGMNSCWKIVLILLLLHDSEF